MAVNDPNYRYATQTWEADGVRTLYEIAFDGGYIRQSDVVAFSVLVDPLTGLTSDRQVHTLTFLSETIDPENEWKSAQVQITPAVADGRRVVIFRSTQKSESMVNFTNGSVLTDKNLDLANQQAILAIAEIMDGLNASGIALNQQVQEIVDVNILIQQIYTEIIEILSTGGILSVEPQIWFGEGDGETTEFTIAGADLEGAGFYDTYVGGVGLEPSEDYTVNVLDPVSTSKLVFTEAPGLGVRWFTVLRGFAKPYSGPAPVVSLRIPVIPVAGTAYFAGLESEFALLNCTNAAAVTVNVKEIPSGGDAASKMGTGSYFSAVQSGTGQVTFAPENGEVTLIVPAGLQAKTRAEGSTITATCMFGDGNSWLLSGDLALV